MSDTQTNARTLVAQAVPSCLYIIGAKRGKPAALKLLTAILAARAEADPVKYMSTMNAMPQVKTSMIPAPMNDVEIT